MWIFFCSEEKKNSLPTFSFFSFYDRVFIWSGFDRKKTIFFYHPQQSRQRSMTLSRNSHPWGHRWHKSIVAKCFSSKVGKRRKNSRASNSEPAKSGGECNKFTFVGKKTEGAVLLQGREMPASSFHRLNRQNGYTLFFQKFESKGKFL
jgi:hypothetical protein